MFFEVISAAQESEEKHLAFYDERNLLETVEKSARSVWLGKIREAIFAILGLQLAEAGSVAVLPPQFRSGSQAYTELSFNKSQLQREMNR